MCTAPKPERADWTPDEDRTTRARIRDAAVTLFADRGVAGTSVRAVAEVAGVSPGLVIHHFGSKEGLCTACDRWVCALRLSLKSSALADGLAVDPLAAVRQFGEDPPALRYLARRLMDNSPHVEELVDVLVADAVALTERGVAEGLINPSDDEYARATVVTLWSLGVLVLHEHLRRLLGEDFIGDPEHATRYLRAVVDILGRSVLTEPLYEALSEQNPRGSGDSSAGKRSAGGNRAPTKDRDKDGRGNERSRRR